MGIHKTNFGLRIRSTNTAYSPGKKPTITTCENNHGCMVAILRLPPTAGGDTWGAWRFVPEYHDVPRMRGAEPRPLPCLLGTPLLCHLQFGHSLLSRVCVCFPHAANPPTYARILQPHTTIRTHHRVTLTYLVKTERARILPNIKWFGFTRQEELVKDDFEDLRVQPISFDRHIPTGTSSWISLLE